MTVFRKNLHLSQTPMAMLKSNLVLLFRSDDLYLSVLFSKQILYPASNNRHMTEVYLNLFILLFQDIPNM